MAAAELLFVYGTLRPPLEEKQRVLCFNHPRVLPFLHSCRPARLPGAELYDLGSFPAAIPGEGTLHGALLEIDRQAFDMLDPLEGHPELYVRTKVMVQAGENDVEAWIYWAPEDLAHAGKRMPGGDWLLSD